LYEALRLFQQLAKMAAGREKQKTSLAASPAQHLHGGAVKIVGEGNDTAHGIVVAAVDLLQFTAQARSHARIAWQGLIIGPW
jgi:hypothetical protein